MYENREYVSAVVSQHIQPRAWDFAVWISGCSRASSSAINSATTCPSTTSLPPSSYVGAIETNQLLVNVRMCIATFTIWLATRSGLSSRHFNVACHTVAVYSSTTILFYSILS